MMANPRTGRRGYTQIQIKILVSLFQQGQMSVYSNALSSLNSTISTDSETFKKALFFLESRRLIQLGELAVNNRQIQVVTLTMEGRELMKQALPLLSKLFE